MMTKCFLLLYFTLMLVRSQFRPDLPPPSAAPCASIQSWTRPATATGLDNKSLGVREMLIIVQENKCLLLWSYIMYEVEMDEIKGQFCVDMWVILCQIIQNFNSARHHRLRFAWKFAQLCPMKKNCPIFLFFGQVVIAIRVVKVWTNSSDPIPLVAHISAPMAPREIILIPLERYLKVLSGHHIKQFKIIEEIYT